MRRIQFAEENLVAYGRPAHFPAQLQIQTVVAEKTQFFRDDERGAVAQGNKAHTQWLRFPARSEMTFQRIMHNKTQVLLAACHGAALADKDR